MGRIVGLVFPVEETGEAATREVEEYPCPHCGKGYRSKASLSKHIKDKHTEATEAQED